MTCKDYFVKRQVLIIEIIQNKLKTDEIEVVDPSKRNRYGSDGVYIVRRVSKCFLGLLRSLIHWSNALGERIEKFSFTERTNLSYREEQTHSLMKGFCERKRKR